MVGFGLDSLSYVVIYLNISILARARTFLSGTLFSFRQTIQNLFINRFFYCLSMSYDFLVFIYISIFDDF